MPSLLPTAGRPSLKLLFTPAKPGSAGAQKASIVDLRTIFGLFSALYDFYAKNSPGVTANLWSWINGI
jgi:hypothetical protein